eukprot:CAMPEP_0117758240 /NCGR_PEP_ID=MMETSP0947-20121206/15256_1 /TAXON_ID=44440 /ORGANISM="Chattonella subsalsa, Strain CCMP2191" /LENGTH=239 /DNA_ID=CAMNT_0005578381 /DNA_START=77 /DNA_END=793 /DNA_ORIENTATION=+
MMQQYQAHQKSNSWTLGTFILTLGIILSLSTQTEAFNFPASSKTRDMLSSFFPKQMAQTQSLDEKSPLIEIAPWKSALAISGGKKVKATPTGAPELERKNPIAALWAAYNRQLENHGARTRMLTSGFISSLGDFLCQLIIFLKSGATTFQFDLRRWVVFLFMGTFYFGTVIFPWFSLLDRFASKYYPKKEDNFKKSVLMISMDQTAGAVGVNAGFIFLFYLVNAVSLGTLTMGSIPAAW